MGVCQSVTVVLYNICLYLVKETVGCDRCILIQGENGSYANTGSEHLTCSCSVSMVLGLCSIGMCSVCVCDVRWCGVWKGILGSDLTCSCSVSMV